MDVTLEIPGKLIDKAGILLDRIPYLSEIITAVSYDQEENAVHLTVSECDLHSAPMDELRTSYQELCASLEHMRVIKERVVKSNIGEEPTAAQPAAATESGAAPQRYYDEFDIRLLEKLDEQFLRIAAGYGAALRDYPSVLNRSNMARNQYHIHFPQNIFGVASVPHNYGAINKFRANAQQDSYGDSLRFQGEMLQPCICYHCYEELQGKELTADTLLTGKGRCFRHEIEWRKNNFRRNEFTMREIVYVGKEEWVVTMRDQIMEDVWRLFESMGMKGRIATATDPFFFSQDLKTKGAYQMMSNAKYELIVTTSANKEVSIASFNYCADTLCSKYEITDAADAALHSGCVAFGIDRWKEAYIDIHGRSLANWPDNKLEKELLV